MSLCAVPQYRLTITPILDFCNINRMCACWTRARDAPYPTQQRQLQTEQTYQLRWHHPQQVCPRGSAKAGSLCKGVLSFAGPSNCIPFLQHMDLPDIDQPARPSCSPGCAAAFQCMQCVGKVTNMYAANS